MNKLNLCLHTGGHLASLDEVSHVPVPEPEGIWHPIAHRTLYDQVVSAMNTLNLRVVNEQHALAKEGLRYFSLLQVGNCREDKDYAYVIGLRGSLDKSYAASIAVGSGVFVCDNLAFTGEITIARKYTTMIEHDLPILAARAVGMLNSKWVDMDKRFAAYKERELRPDEAHDSIIRMLDSGAITTQQIPHILREWREPRHPELAERQNVWRLFNAVTEIGKETSIFSWPKRTMSMHALLDRQCGLVPDAVQPIDAGMIDVEVNQNN